jgi:hypothetical protein
MHPLEVVMSDSTPGLPAAMRIEALPRARRSIIMHCSWFVTEPMQ